MSKFWVKARSVGGPDGDIVIYVKRWWAFLWCPCAGKLHGRMSSLVNAEKEKLNRQCEEIVRTIERIERAAAQVKTAKDSVTSMHYGKDGETKWFKEDVKFLRRIGKDVPPPDEYYKKILHPAVVKKLNKSSENTGRKGSSSGGLEDLIPKNLEFDEGRSIVVGPGTPEHIKEELASKSGADHKLDYRMPSPKEKSGKSKSGNNSWKNRVKGESDEDFEARTAARQTPQEYYGDD